MIKCTENLLPILFLAGIKKSCKETNKIAFYQKDLIGKCVCVSKIAHFKTNRGGMKFTTTASLKIILSLRSKAEKKKITETFGRGKSARA